MLWVGQWIRLGTLLYERLPACLLFHGPGVSGTSTVARYSVLKGSPCLCHSGQILACSSLPPYIRKPGSRPIGEDGRLRFAFRQSCAPYG